MPPPIAAPQDSPARPPAQVTPLPDASRPSAPAARSDPAETRPSTAEDQAPPTLDTLFARLKEAKSDEEAKLTQQMIDILLLQSGSDTIDLLMLRALSAVNNQDLPLALDLLDTVIALKPDYAEGWNKRATIYFLQRDYGKSISDLEVVLRLQPRHVSALIGLATMMRELGDDKHAVVVLKQARAVSPANEMVAKELKDLQSRADGQDL